MGTCRAPISFAYEKPPLGEPALARSLARMCRGFLLEDSRSGGFATPSRGVVLLEPVTSPLAASEEEFSPEEKEAG